MRFVYFGGEPLGVPVLEALHAEGLVPALTVTSVDRPSGRKGQLTPPPTKVWAQHHGIPVIQPESLKDTQAIAPLTDETWDVFVVVAYNAILPRSLINLPTYDTLNLHPSLLPAFRGPSPIRSAILADTRQTGVTVMQMDEQMDHGPIVAQKEVPIPNEAWPMRGRELDALLAREGGTLLASTLPKWVAGGCKPRPQDHTRATYTKKFSRADGELDLDADHYENYLKFCALDGWPGMYFFFERDGKRSRVKITDATFEDGEFKILRVIPEGKKEMDYEAVRST